MTSLAQERSPRHRRAVLPAAVFVGIYLTLELAQRMTPEPWRLEAVTWTWLLTSCALALTGRWMIGRVYGGCQAAPRRDRIALRLVELLMAASAGASIGGWVGLRLIAKL